MFLTYSIADNSFEYELIRLEQDQSDESKVSVPFLEGNYALYLAWIQAQVPAIVAEESVAEEVKSEEPVVAEESTEEPTIAISIDEPGKAPVEVVATPRKRKAA